MRLRFSVRLVGPAMLVASLTTCAHTETPASVPELGPLSMPALVTGRDGGGATLVGGRMLWTFNDTLMRGNGIDGFSYRSATAAWGDGSSVKLDEPLDANAAPYQLIPYTPEELAYNRAHGSNERYALWPDAVVADSPNTGLIFSAYLQVHPGTFNWTRLGTVVSRIQSGRTVSDRLSGTLFQPPEPSFDAGSIVVDGFLYLYSCDPSPCPIARAPLTQATDHSAWQTWNGTTWISDLTKGVDVIGDVPGQLSVSWNAHLNSYLAVHSAPLSNDVVFNTAPHPEGPWSAAQKLFTGRHGANSDYAGLEHPELSRDGGRTLIVSYADASAGFGSVLRLATPTLP